MIRLRYKEIFLLAFLLAASISDAFIRPTPSSHSRISIPRRLKDDSIFASNLKTEKASIIPLYFFGGKEDTVSIQENSQENEFTSTKSSRLETLSGGRLSFIAAKAEDVIRPAADALDEITDGYALTYADLSPETQKTRIGQWFLASNIAYAAAGLALSMKGDIFLGSLTEFCSVASFVYHYTQLDKDSKTDTVRLALFIDYVLAFTSIFAGLGYILLDGQIPPLEGLISAATAISFFLLGLTICAEGNAYIVVHSLWHVFSAYCAFLIGNTHLANNTFG